MAGRQQANSHVKKVPLHLQSSQNRLLIKNGRIINADGVKDADVFIEDCMVKEIGRNLIIPGGTRTIDARNKLVIPGGIDPNTHLQFPTMGIKSVDDFYTGTKAAIAGATTTIIDVVTPEKGESILDAYHKWRSWAETIVCCDYALHVVINAWSPQVKTEMEALVKDHGISSFKVLMTNEKTVKDADIMEILEHCKKLGAVVQVHAENGDVIEAVARKVIAAGVTGPEGFEMSRPEDVEAESVRRTSILASAINCPLYVSTINSKGSAEVVAEMRQRGAIIFGESTAAALGTDGTHYKNESWRHAAAHVTSPPLRPDPATPGYLLDMLAKDDLQVTASDNRTFTHAQKKLGSTDFRKIPDGVNGLEDRMSLLWERGVHQGLMDPCRFVAVTSTAAAKIFNMFPKKGVIEQGSDADIVIWDPKKTRTISAKTHHHGTDNNIFEGIVCHGVPEYVIVKGRLCVEEGQVKVMQGHGVYVPRENLPPFVYDAVREREAKLLSAIKPVTRSGCDGEMISKTGELVTKLTLSTNNSVMQTPMNSAPGSPKMTPANIYNFAAAEDGCRTPTGVRNQQESTFSVAGGESVETRTSVRIRHPPGGRSSGLW